MDVADFSADNDWTVDALRERVRLVFSFDELCDVIRADFLCRLKSSKVVRKTIHVPREVAVLEPA